MLRGIFLIVWILLLAASLVPARAQGGVEAWTEGDFRGERVVLLQDLADLSSHPVLAKGLGSVDVPGGCTVVLFANPGFTGATAVLTGKNARVEPPGHEGRVGSILVHWHTAGVESPSPMLRNDGIILFSEADYRGTSEIFEEDDSNLANNTITGTGVKSVRVPSGYRVTLFEKKRFRGEFAVLAEDRTRADLADLGLKSLGSLMVSWMDTSVPEAQRRRVLLYEDKHFEGKEEAFFTDDPDLRDNAIGSNRASSIRIPEGCTVLLYGERYYRGIAVELSASLGDLRNSVVGDDQVSSIRIMWDR